MIEPPLSKEQPMPTRNRVREFIKENFMFREDRTEIRDEESLLEAGLIDSTGVLELVAFIEGEFGIEMSDSEIVPENLDSIETIVRYVGCKLQAMDNAMPADAA